MPQSSRSGGWAGWPVDLTPQTGADVVMARVGADGTDALQRAREEMKAVLAARPAVGDLDRDSVPAWLSRRYLRPLQVAAVLSTTSGIGVFLINDGPWYLHLVGLVQVVLGLSMLIVTLVEAWNRRTDAARFRLLGPDACDALADRQARRNEDRPLSTVLQALFDLVLVGLLGVVAVGAWDDGVVAQVIAVAVVVGTLAQKVLSRVWSDRMHLWRTDFLREEALQLPPLPEDWEPLLTYRNE
ncbi:hypothetical protein AB0I60_02760 [Actinosynnema sp. NPDC050436]|uniref:hypothetical protein n=1 Tax=Actinosynnema sp. NPDC050436 TaxID=3155659 RepID=UPI0033D0698A